MNREMGARCAPKRRLTRDKGIGLLVSLARPMRTPEGRQEVDGRLLLQRWIDRVALSFFGSARRGAYGVDLLCSPNAHTRREGISLVSPCARERRTPDPSYCQRGGAPTRAHVWTDPGCSSRDGTGQLGRIIVSGARLDKRTNKQAWKDPLENERTSSWTLSKARHLR
jgi:hypothetical protein